METKNFLLYSKLKDACIDKIFFYLLYTAIGVDFKGVLYALKASRILSSSFFFLFVGICRRSDRGIYAESFQKAKSSIE